MSPCQLDELQQLENRDERENPFPDLDARRQLTQRKTPYGHGLTITKGGRSHGQVYSIEVIVLCLLFNIQLSIPVSSNCPGHRVPLNVRTWGKAPANACRKFPCLFVSSACLWDIHFGLQLHYWTSRVRIGFKTLFFSEDN